MVSGVTNAYAHLLFKNGWVLAEHDVDHPDGWLPVKVGKYVLWHDPDVPVFQAGGGASSRLVFIGRAVDPYAGLEDQQDIVTRLAAGLEDGFLDLLDQLTGRFVAIVFDTHGPKVYQDATGTRTVFWSRDVVASHSGLATGDRRDRSSEVERLWRDVNASTNSVRYLPGLANPYKDVRPLTPNTVLNFATARLVVSGHAHRGGRPPTWMKWLNSSLRSSPSPFD